MAASSFYVVIQKVYLAYFGRPADPSGLAFYAKLLNATDARGTSEGFVASLDSTPAVKDMLAGFAASAESILFYSSLDLGEHIKQIYLNVLGRIAEQSGLDYWVAQVSSGNLRLSNSAFVILQAAERHVSGDGLTVANKGLAAALFTASLDTPAEQRAFTTSAGIQAGQDWLANSTATVVLTQAQADGTILTLGDGWPLPLPVPLPEPASSAFAPAPPVPLPTSTIDSLAGITGDAYPSINYSVADLSAGDVMVKLTGVIVVDGGL